MIEAMYWTCADAMTLAAQLGDAQELPSPEVLRQRINVLFSNMSQRGKQVGISDVDLREATYAIAALIDEKLLNSTWSGRTAWLAQQLQLIYFGETTAGEGFFQRLNVLEQTPGKEHLVQIYYLCMTLGFRGQYATRQGVAGDIQAEQEHARNVVAQHLPPSEVLSPTGHIRSLLAAGKRRSPPVVLVGVAVCLVCIIGFVALKIIVSSTASSAADEIKRSQISISPRS
jgi:type VI secretion system protein ImpK